MKQKILELRSQGKKYDEIVQIVGCTKSLVSYYCGQDQKGKTLRRRKRYAKRNIDNIKKAYGAKCCRCGYNEFLEALDFHHLDPSQKIDSVLYLARNFTYRAAEEEAKKCVLLCSNCHRGVHAGKITI